MQRHKTSLMILGIMLVSAGHVSPAVAIQALQKSDPDDAPTVVDPSIARNAEVDVGRIGERQTREDAARATGVKPLARIDTRIANRVQARLRNRIDRNYDPRANAKSPFTVADDQVRAVNRPRQR